MEQLIKQALDTISNLGQSKQIALYRILENLKCEIVAGFVKGEYVLFTEERIDAKGTPLEKIILTQQVETYPGKLLDSLPFPVYKDDLRSGFECVCLPLLNEKSQLKGIAVFAKQKNTTLPPENLQTLNTLCPLITAAIEATQENERLIQLATRDGLTHLYTRRYFETRLQEESTRIRRHGGVMSLLLIDIDHFKQINETCGYKEGNRVLQQVAQLLSTSIRKEVDIPCRFSGKQFIILLPNTDVDGAYILAERIRRRCEQHVFTTQQGIPLKVTLSLGIAHNVDISHEEELINPSHNLQQQQQHNELSKEELIYRADLMLCAAKQAGRNQVMVWW